MTQGSPKGEGRALFLRLVAGVVLGAVIGTLAGPSAAWLGDVGVLVVKLLKALATPLVFVAIVDSLARAEIPRRKGLALVIVCAVNAVVACALALGLSALLRPGTRGGAPSLLADAARGAAGGASAPPAVDVLSSLKGIVPESVASPLVQNHVLATVFLAVLFGVALRRLRNEGAGARLAELVHEAFELMQRVLLLVVQALPLAVGAVVAKVVGESGFAAFASLGALVAVVALGLALHVVVYYGAVAWFVARRSPREFFGAALEPWATSMATGSSMATLPVTLRALERRLGVSVESARLAACVGTNLNNDGIMLYEVVAALFVADALGVPLTVGQKLEVALTSALAAAGIAGVPEAGLITLALVLGAVHLPLSVLPVLLTVDWLLGRLRATTNVTSDLLVATLLDRFDGQADARDARAAVASTTEHTGGLEPPR